MKILKIRFKNINSLEGEHEIDFTQKPFTTNSLFAITGSTGSGKSTVLDVIPLALYNKIPRLDANVSKKMMDENGAILTRGQKEAFARVTYVCKKGIFTSEWMVRVARTGNLQDYEMFLYNEEDKPITQKKSEVPPKNEELIGLNYDQFIKSVMLAQGDFSRFLKVKKEERSALLEQITGTDIYRRLGIAAFEKYKSFKSSVEEWDKKIQELKNQLYTQDEVLAIQEKESLFNEKEIKAKTQLKNVEKELETFNLFQNKTKLVSDLTKQAESIELKVSSFKKKEGERLYWHEKTEDFGDELLQWNALRQEQLLLGQEVAAKLKEREETKNEVEESKRAIEKWTGEASIENAEVGVRLNDFYQKVNAWENERKEKLSKYQEFKSKIESELKNIDLSFGETKKETLKEELIQTKGFLKEVPVSELSKADYLLKKEKLQQELNEIYLAEKEATQIINHQNNLLRKKEQLIDQKEEKNLLEPKIKESGSRLKDLNSEVKILELELENKNLEKTLIEYRRELKENQPCPVCGSVHHPWSEKPIEETNELKEKLEVVQNRYKEESNQKIRLEADLSNLEKNIKSLEEEIKKINEELTPLLTEFKSQFTAFDLNSNFLELTTQKNKELKLWEDVFDAIQRKKTLENVLPLYSEIENISIQGKEIKSKIIQAIGEEDLYLTTQKLQKKWDETNIQWQNAMRNYNEVVEEKSKKEKAFQAIEATLLNKVIANGFTTILSAFSARLTSDEVKALRSQRNALEQERNKIDTEIKIHENELKDLKKQVEGVEVSELKQQKEKIEEEQEKIKNEQKEIFALLSQQKLYVDEIKRLKEKINQENQESKVWRMLNQLIGDAKGKNFNDFAQDLTLNHLLHLANKRLKQLESRYWLSQPNQDEDDGLMAIDQDMGNQRRSVKTLSGGETFILSLALALALSDLASKNVRIETLFIDEGFGTLDPETLDKTLDTLERLQQENQKMIGVISHVEMLKERISTQIQLKQNGNGLSSLHVVG